MVTGVIVGMAANGAVTLYWIIVSQGIHFHIMRQHRPLFSTSNLSLQPLSSHNVQAEHPFWVALQDSYDSTPLRHPRRFHPRTSLPFHFHPLFPLRRRLTRRRSVCIQSSASPTNLMGKRPPCRIFSMARTRTKKVKPSCLTPDLSTRKSESQMQLSLCSVGTRRWTER